MKIKCFKFECSEFGEVSSIQVFYRRDGTVGYARARHKNKQRFYYHKQSNENAIEKIGELSKLDLGQSSTGEVIYALTRISIWFGDLETGATDVSSGLWTEMTL